TLYGGRGIEPDVKIEPQKFTPLIGRLNEATFYFVRQLVAGKIASFENAKVDKQNFSTTAAPNDINVTDKMFEAFRNYAAADKADGLTAANIDSQADYAKMRIREELATATYSNEAGVRVILENDPQLTKAVAVVPQAERARETVAYSRTAR
ncbi:MAG TPA: hypothetical protein VGJ02_01425, partial [Pyrinomonadaceae bacterium]